MTAAWLREQLELACQQRVAATQAPVVSADGRWLWDGTQWLRRSSRCLHCGAPDQPLGEPCHYCGSTERA